MKPFKVNRDSWHYKLNQRLQNEDGYSMHRWEEKHNNFCAYWRATMFRIIFLLFVSLGVLGLLGMMGMAVYNAPLETLGTIGGVILAFSAIVGLVGISEWRKGRAAAKKEAGIPDSLFVAKYKAYKSKICPMVEFDAK